VDSGVLGILGFVLIFVALDVLALRFGQDSRRWVREMPIGTDAVLSLPRPPTLRLRHRTGCMPQRWTGCLAAAVVLHPGGVNPFRPPAPRDVMCFQRIDLVAAGK
jgi:hypothetical protein